ncbi:MAG: lysophospholipid acyltransferase family protein [Nitrospirota bacterium]|nr:lysophospholipid acyltransferase family protein [Nitrospirota bacterium]
MTLSELRPFLALRYLPTWIGIAVMRAISLLPMPAIWLLGSGLGSLVGMFPSKLKKIAAINIRICFPERTDAERASLLRRHFRVLGVSILSYGLGWWSSAERLRKLVHFRDRHHYDQAVASGRNIILFSPHFLALDISGITLSSERPMVSMYRAPRNGLLDAMLRKRGRFGALVFERKDNLKALIRLIREGKPFYYLPDQDPGGADAVFVPFFGMPAATVTAFSRIAVMTNALVIPCYNRILPWGRGFEVRFEAPLAGYPSDDPVQDARRMNESIEKVIRQYPDQYLWSYRRFKTRPAGESSLYR